MAAEPESPGSGRSVLNRDAMVRIGGAISACVSTVVVWQMTTAHLVVNLTLLGITCWTLWFIVSKALQRQRALWPYVLGITVPTWWLWAWGLNGQREGDPELVGGLYAMGLVGCQVVVCGAVAWVFGRS
ncbi:MAG: hypothetical protein AAGA99_07835 [Actinomycetota bacterium]